MRGFANKSALFALGASPGSGDWRSEPVIIANPLKYFANLGQSA
jgi:hypothetical protein